MSRIGGAQASVADPGLRIGVYGETEWASRSFPQRGNAHWLRTPGRESRAAGEGRGMPGSEFSQIFPAFFSSVYYEFGEQ